MQTQLPEVWPLNYLSSRFCSSCTLNEVQWYAGAGAIPAPLIQKISPVIVEITKMPAITSNPRRFSDILSKVRSN